MNLCIDIGNSSVKAGIFRDNSLICTQRVEGHDLSWLVTFCEGKEIDRCIVCSVSGYTAENKEDVDKICNDAVYFSHTTPIPVTNLYHTPETLGPDRLAAAIGAYFETHQDTAVIDAGTAITYDIVTAQGEYLGGNISPGIDIRLKALHDYTARLPLVSADGPLPDFGKDTETAIRCGVIRGVNYEIEQFISQMLLKYPNLLVFLTGGSKIDFEDSIKKRIFVDKYIVLKGLNVVLNNL